ncbi:uncharacterized protein BX663DRAFT_509135, partial [Cokeromyces recurvatus]|uniref:uncharacterized protein n=1 Tax=Cokeromyces recurvatus TaxID=90255 RepID=UPI0022203E0D
MSLSSLFIYNLFISYFTMYFILILVTLHVASALSILRPSSPEMDRSRVTMNRIEKNRWRHMKIASPDGLFSAAAN